MRTRIKFPFVALAALAVFAVSGVASPAKAAGFYLGEQDSVASGRGLAVTAKLNEPSTIFFNPAGMAFLEGINVSAGFTAVFPYFNYSDPMGKRPSAKASRKEVWDPHLYATYTLGKKAAIGIGFNVPFGMVMDWGKKWAGATQIQKIDLKMPTFYFGAAVRPISQLAIGVSLRVVQAAVTLERGFDLVDSNGDPSLGGIKMSTDAVGFGAGLGITARPLDWLHIGFNYLSRVNFDFNNGEGKFTLPKGFDNSIFHDQKGTTRITTPDSVAFGVGFDVRKDVTLELDYILMMWSSYKDLTITFASDPTGQLSKPQIKNWKNASSVRLGGEYRWKDTVAVRASFVWDQTPAPANTLSPDLPDSSRLVGSVGLGYRHPKIGVKVDTYLMFSYFLPREVKSDVNPIFPAKYDAYAVLFGLTVGYGSPHKAEPPPPPVVPPACEPSPAPAGGAAAAPGA